MRRTTRGGRGGEGTADDTTIRALHTQGSALSIRICCRGHTAYADAGGNLWRVCFAADRADTKKPCLSKCSGATGACRPLIRRPRQDTGRCRRSRAMATSDDRGLQEEPPRRRQPPVPPSAPPPPPQAGTWRIPTRWATSSATARAAGSADDAIAAPSYGAIPPVPPAAGRGPAACRGVALTYPGAYSTSQPPPSPPPSSPAIRPRAYLQPRTAEGERAPAHMMASYASNLLPLSPDVADAGRLSAARYAPRNQASSERVVGHRAGEKA